MRLRSLFTAVFVATSATLTVSCGPTDSPVAPSHPMKGAATASRSLLAAPVTIVPVQRTTPLATPMSASAYVGIFGGTLSLPGAGLTVVVPPFAVLSPTLMTVTALAGSNVAYTFEPHGISFLAPLVATQSLQNTTAQGGLLSSLTLQAGYFPDDNNVLSVTELLSVDVSPLGLTSTFNIWHFSGYILAGGVAGDDSTQY